MKKQQSERDTELRKWCIEQAIRWPTIGYAPHAQFGVPVGQMEVDLLGRADRIFKWVRGAAA